MKADLVGSCNYGTNTTFGTGGYVIFADYNDKASTDPFKQFAYNVHNTGTNVSTMRSETVTTVTTTVKIPGEEDDVTTSTETIYGDYNTVAGSAKRTEVTTKTLYYSTRQNKWIYSETVTTNGETGEVTYPTATDAPSQAAQYGITDNHNATVVTETTVVINNENYPYVTTSPKTQLDNQTNPVFLTGDGIVSSLGYDNSNFKKIVSDTTNKKYTEYKRYGDDAVTSDPLTQDDKVEIVDHYSSTAAAYNNNANVLNFPLLVVDDVNTTNTTRLINNYINVLANTNYNYADTTNSSIYNVKFYKYRLDSDPESSTYNKQFVYIGESSTEKNCLKTTGERNGNVTKYVFKMSADNVDTGTIPQFTLMDVQYFDPSGSEKIAYHLYVPIYVNQLLRFDYKASVASNTDYYSSAYSTTKYMFENLGNPVTMEFEYTYRRTPSEWAEIINSGVNVLTNYYKTLNFKTHTNSWPANARLVLVDAANKDKFYYLDDPYAKCQTYIDLYDFVEKNGSTHFTPAPMQNLMSLAAVSSIDGKLIKTTNNTSTGATVCINGTYYRPTTEEDTDTSLFYRIVSKMNVTEVVEGGSGELIADDSPNAVTVVDSDNNYYRPATDEEKLDTTKTKYDTVKSQFDPERYYLSIFTKENSSDNTIYHFEIQSRETFEKNSIAAKTSVGTNDWELTTGWQPNKMFGTNTELHIILGNLYENDFSLVVTPMIGINAYESKNTSSFVDTYALYDIRDIQNPGDYIELTLSLSRSGSYIKPTAGNPQSTGTPLDITEYIQDMMIYGQDISETNYMDVLYNMNQDTEVNQGNSRTNTLTASLSQDKHMLTIRVHKSLLRTQGNADSNIYMIPIKYKVKTGDTLFKNDPDGLRYSNYKVSVTAATYSSLTSDPREYTQASYAYDHLIYTNTKVNPNVIE